MDYSRQEQSRSALDKRKLFRLLEQNHDLPQLLIPTLKISLPSIQT